MIAIIVSNLFIVDNSNPFTSVVSYRSNRNSYEIEWAEADENFTSQARIGLYLRAQKTPVKEKVYQQQNGYFRFGNVRINKSFDLQTELLDEKLHESLAIASKHDFFYIDNKQYFSQGDYDVGDEDLSNLSNGKMTVFEQNYNKSNLSC